MTFPPITAMVSMKGHSARVPRKNLRPLCGRPLYHWIVTALAASRYLSRIVIETDSDEIAGDAMAHFEVTLLRRPLHLLGDHVVMNPLIASILDQVEGEHFLQTHATNPLLTAATIDRAIEAYFSDGRHDSLFTVSRWQTRLYWPDGRGVNHDPAVLIPTQDLPPILEENSCLYLFSRGSFAASGRRIGLRPAMFETPPLESVDIDEEHNFRYCEFLMRERLAGAAAEPALVNATA